jgi:hypothetical protein
MKKIILNLLTIGLAAITFTMVRGAEPIIDITTTINPFGQKPIPVALDGFTGEAAEVLKFDS